MFTLVNGLRKKINGYFQLSIKRIFEFVIIMSLFIIVLTPLNNIGNPYQNITATQIIDNQEYVYFKSGYFHSAKIGDKLNFYRFNPQWTKPIGQVEIIEKNKNEYKAKAINSTFVFPLGIQGSIVSQSNHVMSINLGQLNGIRLKQRLNIFDEQRFVGQAEIVYLNKKTANIRVLNIKNEYRNVDLTGFQISIYTVANAVYLPKNDVVKYVQWLILTIILTLWLYSLFSKSKDVWGIISEKIKWTIKNLIVKHSMLWLVIMGGAISYFIGELIWYMLTHTYKVFNASIFNRSIMPYSSDGVWPTRIVIAFLYYYVLFFRQRNPLLTLYQALEYSPQRFFGAPKFIRCYIIWALHLVVFFAFAYTLGTILTNNLKAIVHIGWLGFSQQQAQITPLLFGWIEFLIPEISNKKFFWDHIYELLAYILSNRVQPLTASMVYSLIRLILWSITITMCLSFYSYAVVSILWNRKLIRNIDFTMAGWITTAICYGPLLGGVLYKMLPSAQGPIPTFDVDAWMWLTLTFEALLNLLYTLSIFNMGKKFGVLVDKGVVSTGFYAIIRHPGYLLEVMMFIMISIISLSGILQWVAILGLIIKYWLRAEREDQFMSGSNPEYIEYKKKVPYKFIPKLY